MLFYTENQWGKIYMHLQRGLTEIIWESLGDDEPKFWTPVRELILVVKVNGGFAELMLNLYNFIIKKPEYLQNYPKEQSFILK